MSDGWISAAWPAPPDIVAGTTLRDSLFALPAEPQWLNQVHGTRAVRWGTADFDAGPPDADAVIADRPNACCAVRTADCLPILLCAVDGVEIAAIHAGWRGLAAGVVEQTIAAMSTPARQLMAWFGPAISQPAYEVGSEVRQAFLAADKDADKAFARNDRGRWQADLFGLATQRLNRAGVGRIFGGGLCTYADPVRFCSYRRDKDPGRMLSFVYRA